MILKIRQFPIQVIIRQFRGEIQLKEPWPRLATGFLGEATEFRPDSETGDWSCYRVGLLLLAPLADDGAAMEGFDGCS